MPLICMLFTHQLSRVRYSLLEWRYSGMNSIDRNIKLVESLITDLDSQIQSSHLVQLLTLAWSPPVVAFIIDLMLFLDRVTSVGPSNPNLCGI